VRVIDQVDAFGEHIAAAPDGERWAVSYVDRVTVRRGTQSAGEVPEAPEAVLDLDYAGATLNAAPSRYLDGTWEPLAPLAALVDPWRIVAAAWTGDRMIVAAGAPANGPAQEVRVYDGRTRKLLSVLWADSQWERVEAVAGRAGRLAAAALEVRVWDSRALEEVCLVPGRDRQVRRLRFIGEALAIGYADGWVAVAGGAGWQAHEDEACAIAASPGGQRFATGGWDGRVALWTPEGELVDEIDVGVEVEDLAFLGADRLLALHRLPETGVSIVALRS
jgi:hypothetical protein